VLVREAAAERIDLRPLDATAIRALVDAHYDLPDDEAARLAGFLMARTEGNALFLTELLRTIKEEGLLHHEEGRWRAETTAPVPVPRLLKQIIDGRVSRLGDEASALLTVAAVIGQEVPLAVWQAVTQVDEETLVTIAERAEALHLVHAWANGAGMRFAHALIHDVLYEDVPALRRRRLHRQVGEVLARSAAPDPDAVASHYQQAGDTRAAAWLTRAGERAENAYALVTAAQRYEAAFTLLDAQQGDPAERGWVRLLAAALRHHEGLVQARAWVEEAMQLAREAGDPSLSARAQALFGLHLLYRGEYRTAMANFASAVDLIDRLPPETGITRRAQQIDKVANRGTLISFLAYSGRLAEARTQGEIYLARRAQSATTPGGLGAIANAHSGLGVAYALQGEPVLARQSYAATVAEFDAIDQHMFALNKLCEELILAVLPYQADNLAERERIAAAAERMARWMLERGGHGNLNLPRYARIPLMVLEGEWREAHRILESLDTADITIAGRGRRGMPTRRGGAYTSCGG
jgi:hypothetical protein